MQQNSLFSQTRLRLAGWYAGVMSCILTLCSFGVYHTVAHAYQETIDQSLESAASALRSSIEPALQQPGQLQRIAQQFSLQLCQTQAACNVTSPVQDKISTAVNPVKYYLRLVQPNRPPFAQAGVSLSELPEEVTVHHLQTLMGASGTRYRQIALPLGQQNHFWGYLQIGRSLTDLDEHLAALRLTMLFAGSIAMLLVLASAWWLAGLAMQPIYQSYQQMQQFTADAAHELRTPLAAMQSVIESTLRLSSAKDSTDPSLAAQGDSMPVDSIPVDPISTFEVLKRQTQRLVQLVQDLLLLARMEQRPFESLQTNCCLNDLVSDLEEELAPLAIEAQVKLVAQPYPQPVYICGNEDQLYRLVCNLIYNAIQATRPGGYVQISLDCSEENAIIQVQDTGIGMTAAEAAHIFDRFYRVQADRSRHTGGSGLGLAIAKAIAQRHQGNIQVQSQPGQGSTFTVRLPVR